MLQLYVRYFEPIYFPFAPLYVTLQYFTVSRHIAAELTHIGNLRAIKAMNSQ